MIAIHWAARFILVLLMGLSVWSVATMIATHRLLQKSGLKVDMELPKKSILEGQWKKLEDWATSSGSIQAGMVTAMIASGSEDPGRIDRTVRSYLSERRTEIERGLTTLATLGSNAPFIGLFGTVLGIIQAFGALGGQQASTASVMVGISEALVATAIGLFVAIPAVISYNYLSRSLRVILVNCESLRDLYLARKNGS